MNPGGDNDLSQVVPGGPRSIVDRLHLDQIGPRAHIPEGDNVIAERILLTGHSKVLHDREVALLEIGNRCSTLGHHDEDVGGVSVP